MCVYNKIKERVFYFFIIIIIDIYWIFKCGIICFEKLCFFFKIIGLFIVIVIYYVVSIFNFLY